MAALEEKKVFKKVVVFANKEEEGGKRGIQTRSGIVCRHSTVKSSK